MESNAKRLSYLPQLDSFRFFAVLLVMFSHWLDNTVINRFPNGFVGVTFFFVLSGFLISSNLLYTRKELDAKRVSFAHAIRTFYIRRTLRIFPLYFLVIFVVFIFVPAAFMGHLWWYVCYIPNFLVFKMQEWPGMLSHFWSLGVEEQFYLVWPFLIFLFPAKFLKYLFPGIILLSTCFKIYMFKANGAFLNFYDALPVSCFDAFGAGALLALVSTNHLPGKNLIARVPFGPGFALSVFICWMVYATGLSFLFGAAVSLASVFLIHKALNGYTGWFGRIVDNTFIRYLGKISYGLYVYHNFIPWLLRCLTGKETKYPLPLLPVIKADWLHGAVVLFVAHFLLLLAIASISWFLIEKPINNMKKYFV